MKLGSLIDKDFILVGKEFASMNEAVTALIELFAKRRKLPVPSQRIMEIHQERANLGGLVLPTGVAIPHGRIDGFHDLLIGVWIPPKPLETPDGVVKALFFSLTSKTGTALYLPVLSALSALSTNTEQFGRLLSATTRSEAQEILDRTTLKQEVTVEDIMNPSPITCFKESTLAELADTFKRHKVSYVPVVDEQQQLIGEVTIKDLISRGIPDYVRRLGNARFLKTLEPFEALLREEDRILVKEIMRKPTRSITRNASIIETATIITGKQVRHIPVTDSGKLVGLVSETDILDKVIRG